MICVELILELWFARLAEELSAIPVIKIIYYVHVENDLIMAPGTKVRYKDPILLKEGTFEILECDCNSCRSGNTHLVNLKSLVVEVPGSYRHVGFEMIEEVP